MTISLSIKISTDYLVSHNTVRQILLKLLINNEINDYKIENNLIQNKNINNEIIISQLAIDFYLNNKFKKNILKLKN